MVEQSNNNLEHEIDKVTRLIREYLRTGNKDVMLVSMIKNMVWKLAMVNEKDQSYFIEYGLNRLLSEVKSPETVNRNSDSEASYW